MCSYSIEQPEVEKYDDQRFRVPFCIDQMTVGEGEEAVSQYKSREMFVEKYPSLSDRRALIATALNKDVGAYIYGHYDAGTQQSFQAMIAMDDVPEETKSAIKSIFPWIQDCLGYYYGKKAEVWASSTPELVVWDFSQFDTTKPDVSLSSIVSGS